LGADVPERLLEVVDVPSESIVFRTLCGATVSKHPPAVVSSILIELKKCLNTCVSHGLVGEGSYVKNVIEKIQKGRAIARPKNLTAAEVSRRLAAAEEQLERTKTKYDNKRAVLEAEKTLALDDLQLRHADNMERLQEEWGTEHIQAKFNKPSPGLIELRRYAISLMAAGRFEEAAGIGNEISDRDAKETEEAAKRMAQAYQRARERLKQQLDSDTKAAGDSYDVKLLGVTKDAENRLRYLTQRVETMERTKAELETVAKRSHTTLADSSLAPKRVVMPMEQEPLVVNRKLKLPPLSFITESCPV
jgi:hypothetical protein